MKKSSIKSNSQNLSPSLLLEAEVAQGIEDLAWQEVQQVFGKAVKLHQIHPSAVRFWYQGKLDRLWSLSLVQAVYDVQSYNVPRPKALLGDQHFRALLAQIDRIRQVAPSEYRSFFISAAGSESGVMQRLRQSLAASTGLADGKDQGDLLIRLIHASMEPSKWETLVRVSPRPLATRAWRICNFEGALNATIARAMIVLTEPTVRDYYVNLACGSGTLLVERLGWGRASHVLGIDNDAAALECAVANIAHAGRSGQIELLRANAERLPLMSSIADVLCADLPFGQLVGSHQANLQLYPRLLIEAARIARPAARFVVLTHEVRLMESLLENDAYWEIKQIVRITQRGLHPRIYVLRRNAQAV